MKRKIQTDYLKYLFRVEDFDYTIDKLRLKLNRLKSRKKFDSIAFTGVSGAGVAFPISYLLEIPLICVRKSEVTHSRYRVEGNRSCKKYIILDDFVDSGRTFKTIIDEISLFAPRAQCVGIVTYDQCRSTSFRKYKNNKIPIYYY